MVRVKVCGITREEDALLAAELGADALGFVFHRASPRYITPREAGRIIQSLPPFLATVGVFVDAPLEEVESVIEQSGLSVVQLHGREPPEFCTRLAVKVIKALRVKGNTLPSGIDRYRVDALLLDTYREGLPGGTGTVFPWEVAREAKAYGRLILAGGLHPGNVREAVERVGPYAVDVSSGVEASPGRKDPALLAAFLQRAKGPIDPGPEA